MAEIAVIGAGSFGAALCIHCAGKGHGVRLWCFSDEEYEYIHANHDIGNKLKGVKLPEDILLSTDLEKIVQGADATILAVPSPFVRGTAKKLSSVLPKGATLISVAKGLEESTLSRLSQVIEEEIPEAEICILCGPSHAEEVAIHLPTALVAGAKKRETAEKVQSLMMNETLRVYTSPDLIGMETGAALKNVIALAAGMSDGLGFGDNTKAALITRGIAEITRLSVAMGAEPETLSGLTGIGDLVVTCMSRHSRNRNCGFMIGQGVDPEEAVKRVGMVVEGVNSARAAKKLAEKYYITMPITEEVNAVLYDGVSAREAVGRLMGRDRREEHTNLKWE
ncbi:MAG: NAD(P)-dependent glycerol-3-phosphate dehydrogenase [Lachnospiraceae bacterium]|nr:NAD(P)-dependent glycerol-3-phosphate dehydrogenase [Lachnospiraceae bacterium]